MYASNWQIQHSGVGRQKLQGIRFILGFQFKALILAFSLTGCASVPFIDKQPELPKGVAGHVSGFYGGVVADEPRAVLAGRDVLTAGGVAADAATAVYFMLAVTMPSAAGLGGGGICLVRDTKTQTVETLDFFGQPSSGEGRKVTVPGNPRGLYALHARFGSLRWAELIRPAENVARFGARVSRAFAEEIQRASNIILKSKYLQSVYSTKNNTLFGEGTNIKQQELASFIARLRARGAGALHSGINARMFAEDARRAGIGLTYADLVAAKPAWRPTLRVPLSANRSMHFAMPRSAGGTLGAKVAAIFAANDLYKESKIEEREHLVAEAIQRAIADGANGFMSVSNDRQIQRGRWKKEVKKITSTELPEGYAEQLMVGYRPNRLTDLATEGPGIVLRGHEIGTTSFVVIDRKGGAVACAFSMNGAFGTGEVVPGTGVILANPWPAARYRDLSLGLMMIDHNFRNKIYMVGSGSGDPAAQAVLAQLSLKIALAPNISLEKQVIARNRIFRDPINRITYLERGMDPVKVRGLVSRGHRILEVPNLSRINLAYCRSGLPERETFCSVAGDPRGFGFSSMAE